MILGRSSILKSSRRLLVGLGMIILIGIALSFSQPPVSANKELEHPSATRSQPVPTQSILRASTLSPAHAWVPKSMPTSVIEMPPEQTLAEAEIPEESPDYFYIQNISGHQQWFSIGCEASAAVDWAAYYGVPINEREFQTLLPVSDNPDLGFVGDVKGAWGLTPPDDYGVHAAPVADLLHWYGLDAISFKGMTLDELKSSIAQSKPVIAWVVGNVTYGTPVEYVDREGNSTIVAAYEHVVIVTGYNFESVRYLNNGTSYDVSTKLFMESWGVLGNMAIVMGSGTVEE